MTSRAGLVCSSPSFQHAIYLAGLRIACASVILALASTAIAFCAGWGLSFATSDGEAWVAGLFAGLFAAIAQGVLELLWMTVPRKWLAAVLFFAVSAVWIAFALYLASHAPEARQLWQIVAYWSLGASVGVILLRFAPIRWQLYSAGLLAALVAVLWGFA